MRYSNPQVGLLGTVPAYKPKLGISFRAHGRLPGARGVGC